MKTNTLLIEIGTEELPPKSLNVLAETFAGAVEAKLQQLALGFERILWFATPRRLAVQVCKLAEKQQNKQITKRGPKIQAAFDANGAPTAAAKGWMKANGITIEQSQRLVTDQGEWLFIKQDIPGQTIEKLLPQILMQAVSQIPMDKAMRWGNQPTAFIRPVHSLTVMYGEQVITSELFGCQATSLIYGHRFMGKARLQLTHANNYISLLNDEGYVMADYKQRKSVIKQQVIDKASELGGNAIIDDDLLTEVTSLVEWPVALAGSFDKKFLTIPSEVLIYSMKNNQKYFPVVDHSGALLAKFIFIANIDNTKSKQIITGNQRVIQPRLADANFFFNIDQQSSLFQRLQSLEGLLFHNQLGSMREKAKRLSILAGNIADQLNANVALTKRAGLLAKTDLVTSMVIEFPGLQGVMGMYYASNDGEPEQVALAIRDHYLPRFSGDKLPNSLIFASVALADKLDNLVGFFGIGLAPKGDKDPLALRRAAIGILRIIIEKQLNLNIQHLIAASIALYKEKLTNKQVAQEVATFILQRLNTWYQEQGKQPQVIKAVLSTARYSLVDIDRRIQAINRFQKLPEALTLVAAHKRVHNILNKTKTSHLPQVNVNGFIVPKEQALHQKIVQISKQVERCVKQKKYDLALAQLTQLSQPVAQFFDEVIIMDKKLTIRQNRLALLSQLHRLFLTVADISCLN